MDKKIKKAIQYKKVQYGEMLPWEAVKSRKAFPVAYLPIGGIEWHGEQNCLGLDTVKVHAIAIECARKIGGVVFPSLFYGEPREHYLMEADQDGDGQIANKMELPKSNFSPGYMQEQGFQTNFDYVKLLHHIMLEIRSLGFEVIIVLVGHYPLLRHARAACELFRLDYEKDNINAWSCSGYELVKDIIPSAGDHAAAWETSLMMYLRPDLVDMTRLPKDLNVKLIGVHGRDPRKYASVKYGKKGVDAIVTRISAKAHELLGR